MCASLHQKLERKERRRSLRHGQRQSAQRGVRFIYCASRGCGVALVAPKCHQRQQSPLSCRSSPRWRLNQPPWPARFCGVLSDGTYYRAGKLWPGFPRCATMWTEHSPPAGGQDPSRQWGHELLLAVHQLGGGRRVVESASLRLSCRYMGDHVLGALGVQSSTAHPGPGS